MNDEMPVGLEYVRTTEVFDQDHHPAGLLREHRVADGVWARLVVHTGALVFVFDDKPGRPRMVAAGEAVVIPGGRPHHVELPGPVTFALEFHREPARRLPPPGGESTGLG